MPANPKHPSSTSSVHPAGAPSDRIRALRTPEGTSTGTNMAFLFMMGAIGLGVLYFLLVAFIL